MRKCPVLQYLIVNIEKKITCTVCRSITKKTNDLINPSFLLGLSCMLVYYGALHPSGSKLKSMFTYKGKDINLTNSSVSIHVAMHT